MIDELELELNRLQEKRQRCSELESQLERLTSIITKISESADETSCDVKTYSSYEKRTVRFRARFDDLPRGTQDLLTDYEWDESGIVSADSHSALGNEGWLLKVRKVIDA